MAEIYGRLREMFREQLHVDVPAAETDLLESGILDSLQFVTLLAHVEREFGVAIPLADLSLEQVSTLDALADLVRELSA
jgi:acyl carrier protein